MNAGAAKIGNLPNWVGNLKHTFHNKLLSTWRLECDRQLIASRFSFKWNIITGIWTPILFYSFFFFLFLLPERWYFNMHSSHYLACHVETAQKYQWKCKCLKIFTKIKKKMVRKPRIGRFLYKHGFFSFL